MKGAECPRCRTPLAAAEAPDVAMYPCAACGGVWLDHDAVKIAAEGLSPRTIEILINVAAGARLDADPAAPTSCPSCARPLSRTGINGVAIAHCPDHGAFFDRGELVRVSRVRTAAATPGPPSPSVPSGFQAPPPMLAEELHLAQHLRQPAARTSGMAIAGLVFAFLCPIIGLVIAWKAQRDIQASGGRLKGEGLATAGIVISVINMALGVFLRLQS